MKFPSIDSLSSASYTIGDFKITGWSIMGIVIVIASSFLIIKIARILLNRYARRFKIDEGRVKSVIQILKYFIWVTAIIICLDLIHVKITLLLASAAALLVGVGFGLQNVFADIIGGLIILFDGSIEMDDVVQVSDLKGKVKKIMLRNTILKTQNDTTVIIPNRKFIDDNIINFSHHNELTRYYIEVNVAYGSDTKLVKDILIECANKHNAVDKTKKAFVRFDNFGDSALVFNLIFWCKENLYIELVKSDIRFIIDEKFRENNIIIPFPQRDINFKNKLER